MLMYVAGTMKEYIRNDVFLHLTGCKYVFTLPNLYFNLEQRLLNNAKVDCAEIKKPIYLKQKDIVPKGIKLYHANIIDLDVTKYDGLFLDMCGPFSIALSTTLSNVKLNSKLVITLLMARENNYIKTFINIKEREKSYISLFNKYGISISKYINYSNTTPMCTFFGTKIL